MRGVLSSTIAAIRAYRRVAAQTKPTRSAEHDLSGVGVHPTAGVMEFAGNLFKSPRRRSVIAMAAAVTLAVAALAAACLGAAKLNEGSHSAQPHTVIEPYGAVPAATTSTKNTANDHAPATSPMSATGAAGGVGPGATQAAAGATSGTGAGAATGGSGGGQTTTDPVPSPSAAAPSASPTLLDLCRSVVAAGNSWPSVLKSGDRATVTAAAGTKKNVLPYCTSLVANAS